MGSVTEWRSSNCLCQIHRKSNCNSNSRNKRSKSIHLHFSRIDWRVVGRQVWYIFDYCPFKSSNRSSSSPWGRKSRISRQNAISSHRTTNVSFFAYISNISDPILAMAVINALGPLVKTRHTLSSKIINAFLSVDIISIPHNSPDPTKAQLQLRSVSKTLRIQLSHFLRYPLLSYRNGGSW